MELAEVSIKPGSNGVFNIFKIVVNMEIIIISCYYRDKSEQAKSKK